MKDAMHDSGLSFGGITRGASIHTMVDARELQVFSIHRSHDPPGGQQ